MQALANVDDQNPALDFFTALVIPSHMATPSATTMKPTPTIPQEWRNVTNKQKSQEWQHQTTKRKFQEWQHQKRKRKLQRRTYQKNKLRMRKLQEWIKTQKIQEWITPQRETNPCLGILRSLIPQTTKIGLKWRRLSSLTQNKTKLKTKKKYKTRKVLSSK